MRRVANAWRRLPVATKVPLSLFVLLSVVLVGISLLAWIEVRRSHVQVASERLARVTQQLTTLLTSGWSQRFAALQTIAATPAIAAYLRDPSPAARAAAFDTLAAIDRRAGQNTSLELWDPAGTRLFSADDRPVYPSDAAARTVAALGSLRVGVGPFVSIGNNLEYTVAAVVGAGNRRDGWLVERRRVTSGASSTQLLEELTGTDARFLVGNRTGDVWTNFTSTVEPPPVALADSAMTLRYRRDGMDVLAHAIPVNASPWSVIVEFPVGPVLEPASRFLTRTLLFSLALTLIGTATGSVLTRRVTATLERVSAGAEAITHGRPASPVETTREDEIGRLAGSFTAMAREVEDARRRLEELVERYRLLFDANPLPLWLFDAETLQVLDVNDAAVRHYGWTREEFLAMRMSDIRSPEEADRLKRHLTQSDEGLADAGYWQHRKKDGTIVDVEITRHVIELGGRRVVLSLANDVTARLAAERAHRESAGELRRLNSELEARVAERTAALEVTNAELEAFSYSVSHDLRAPLRAIDGFSRILQEDHAHELSENARRNLAVIARNARQMGQLIDDLLAFSRLSRQPLNVTAVDMTALVRQVADEAQRDAGDRPIELVVDALPAVRGERALLRQVWANYLQNAMKFTRDRSPARIEIGHRLENGEAIFFVRDNGAGFDMKYADKLFGVFQRLHRPEEFEGTGVGLAIVKRIVSRHGGRVWAEGEEGRGATFYFTLPTGTSHA